MNNERNDNGKSSSTELEVPFSVSVRRFLHSFKKYWWVSVVCGILLFAMSFTYFKLTFQPRYRSEVRFTVTPLVESDAANGASVYSFNYNSTLATQMASTFPYIINSGIMSDIIANDLRRPFDGAVSASAVTDTNIFEVSVTSTSAQDAYDILNSIIKNYPKVAEYVVGDTHMTVIDGSEPFVATEPYNSGEYYKYVALCGLAGILIGVIVMIIDMKTRQTVMTKRDIESHFNGKCICEIPVVKRKRTSKAGTMLKIGPSLSAFSESLRVLKQRIRSIMRSKNAKVIGITSTGSEEGKTTICYNLAKSLSSGDDKVLLIDMDLHKRGIQNNLNRRQEVPNTGVTDVASGKVEIGDVINSVSDTFDVLFAGEENIKFRKASFNAIFEYARENYDYIIVDMPVCDVVSETVSIADLCDQILFVIRANSVSPDRIYSCLKDISFSDAHIMGFVLNFVEQGAGEMGGYKYYGRYGKRRYGYGYGYNYANYGYSYGYTRNVEQSDSSDE